MHENRQPARRAACASRRPGKNIWPHVEIAVTLRSNAAITASSVSLEDGRKLRAPLLVAADGRNSPTREAAGINVARWNYDHQAIVSVFATSGRTRMSPTRSSIRPGRSRSCR